MTLTAADATGGTPGGGLIEPLDLTTPITDPVTRDLTIWVTEASGTVTPWQVWLERRGDRFRPGPGLTVADLEEPLVVSSPGGADDTGGTGSQPASTSHAGLGYVPQLTTAITSSQQSGAAAGASDAGGAASDFDLGIAHMHAVPREGGAPLAEFDEFDLVASGSGLIGAGGSGADDYGIGGGAPPAKRTRLAVDGETE